MFQLTHSQGVRQNKQILLLQQKRFQLTHSQGVRHGITRPIDDTFWFQLTHSQGVRHSKQQSDLRFAVVSTHALARSATFGHKKGVNDISVSTHALARSATLSYTTGEMFNLWFQLTHSQGVRHLLASKFLLQKKFQLTHSQGVRPLSGFKTVASIEFQLTHSQGVRPIQNTYLAAKEQFQLTHSQGVRHRNQKLKKSPGFVSTHALARSATFSIYVNDAYMGSFNSRTRKECDV